jgi:hypothetical protein
VVVQVWQRIIIAYDVEFLELHAHHARSGPSNEENGI